MNEIGLQAAWLAVQIGLVLAPVLAVSVPATRRAPAYGSWVLAVSLGMVIGLTGWAFLPGAGVVAERSAGPSPAGPAASPPPSLSVSGPGKDNAARPSALGPAVGGWRVAWARLGRGVSAPVARCRPWGSLLAVGFVGGAAVGLLRLALGLGSVAVCCRRGRAVDDPDVLRLLHELRGAIGCRGAVGLREVPGLGGPATAGWRRPLILLPDDWRAWDDSERRAVLAHELAHVARGDYAAGLVARLALALNPFHPLVRWAAGRMQLQQELAADALGARHAGGNGAYLVALSRLALRQDGRSPRGPARAFLPTRGTLIRRIAMLRDETRSASAVVRWSAARRLSTALVLLGLTAGVAALRGPAVGSEADAPAPAPAPAPNRGADAADQFFPPRYVRDGMNGVAVVRPALAFRQEGMGRFAALVDGLLTEGLAELSASRKVDPGGPDPLTLSIEDVECVTFNLGVGASHGEEGAPLHRLIVGGTTAVRTVGPFNWLAYLRQWGFTFAEVREEGRAYYRVEGPLKALLGPDPCVYLPDDRTLVFDEEAAVRELAFGGARAPAGALAGADWERACRGIFAVAVVNEDGSFVKNYDLGRPDDALALPLFEGVDRWVLAADADGPLALRAVASCRDAESATAVTKGVETLVSMGKAALKRNGPVTPSEPHGRALRIAGSFLAGLRVERTGRSVEIRAVGFGTLADLAAFVEAEATEKSAGGQD